METVRLGSRIPLVIDPRTTDHEESPNFDLISYFILVSFSTFYTFFFTFLKNPLG